MTINPQNSRATTPPPFTNKKIDAYVVTSGVWRGDGEVAGRCWIIKENGKPLLVSHISFSVEVPYWSNITKYNAS